MTESNSPQESETATESAPAAEQAGNGKPAPSPAQKPSPSPPAAEPAAPDGSANGSARDATQSDGEQAGPQDGVAAAAPPPWMRVSWDAESAAALAAAASQAPADLADPESVQPEASDTTETQEVPTAPAGSAYDGARTDPRFGPPTGPVPLLESPLPGPGWSATRSARTRQPRQAHLQLKRLDPWSVLKLSLVLAVVLFFVWMVAVAVLYGVLEGMGVWDQINVQYNELAPGAEGSGESVISVWRVLGFAAVVGAINSLLFAVAATLTAFVYNASADLVGGIEVTLSERE